MKAKFLVTSVFLFVFVFPIQGFQNGALNYFSALSWVEEIQEQYLTPAFWNLFSADQNKFKTALRDFKISLSSNNETAIEQLIIGSTNEKCDFSGNVVSCIYANPVSYVKFTNFSRVCWAAAILRCKMGEIEEANEILFSLIIFSIRFSKAAGFLFFQSSLSVCEHTLSLIENLNGKTNNKLLKRSLKGQFLLSGAIEKEWQTIRQKYSYEIQPQNDEIKCFKELPFILQKKFLNHIGEMRGASKPEVVMDYLKCVDIFFQKQIERLKKDVFSPEDYNIEKMRIQKGFPELGPIAIMSTVPIIFRRVELINKKLKALSGEE